MMSAIGSGATRPGVCVLSLGTSGTVFSYASAPIVDPEGLIAPFCDSTGGWLPLLCVMNVTGVLEEVRSHAPAPNDLAALTRAAERIEPGSCGVLFIPYLIGERVPDLPEASGALLGLRPGSLDPALLFRAALEGTALNLGWGVDRLRGLGVPIDSVRVVGGGAKNPLWRAILADVLDAPLVQLEEPESAALGAALQAAWCLRRSRGEHVSADEVSSSFIRLTDSIDSPNPSRVSLYRDASARFRDAVEDFFPQRTRAPAAERE
jgi:sugar (pentulose or hexulose) kinase